MIKRANKLISTRVFLLFCSRGDSRLKLWWSDPRPPLVDTEPQRNGRVNVQDTAEL
jgi:hypothetical protein